VVSGELDLAVAGEVAASLVEAPHDGRLVLDLSDVSFMDSTGLGLLLRTSQRARSEGWRLEIVPSSAVSRVIEVTASQHLLDLDGNK
jgi:anti-anti-sigma factor